MECLSARVTPRVKSTSIDGMTIGPFSDSPQVDKLYTSHVYRHQLYHLLTSKIAVPHFVSSSFASFAVCSAYSCALFAAASPPNSANTR